MPYIKARLRRLVITDCSLKQNRMPMKTVAAAVACLSLLLVISGQDGGGKNDADRQIEDRKSPKPYRITHFCEKLVAGNISTTDPLYGDVFTHLNDPCTQYLAYLDAANVSEAEFVIPSGKDKDSGRPGEKRDIAVDKMMGACKEVKKQLDLTTIAEELKTIYTAMIVPCTAARDVKKPTTVATAAKQS